MQKLKAHSLRSFLVVLISLGIFINIVRITTYAHASQSFANWLSTVVKDDGNQAPALSSKIKALENSRVELHQLITEASVLVSKHSNSFSLPMPQATDDDGDTDDQTNPSSTPDPQTIFNLLISEWNSSESHNAMHEVLLQKGSNWALYFFADHLLYTIPDDARKDMKTLQYLFTHQNFLSFCNRWIIPFASGIAIGAP